MRVLVWPSVVGDPGMYGSSLYGNREISELTNSIIAFTVPLFGDFMR